MASIYFSNQAAGRKMKGGNITPNGPYMTDLSAVYGTVASFPWFVEDLCLGTNDQFTKWVHPSMDVLQATGANCFRFVFDVTPLFLGRVTQLQFETMAQTLARAGAERGLWFYPGLQWARYLIYAHDTFGMSVANFKSLRDILINALDDEPNVLGYDIVQEIDETPGDFAYVNRASWFEDLTTTKSVTCSLNGTSSALDWSKGQAIVTAGATHADYHVYGGLAQSDYDAVLNNADGIPVCVGEIGLSVVGNATTGGFTGDGSGSTDVAGFFFQMAELAARPRIQLVEVWSSVDYFAAGLFGLTTIAQNGSYAFTTPKTDPYTRFTNILTTIPPYDAAEDGYAVVESAPTVVALGVSAVSMSWSAAVGGSGTITYTPQYVTVNADGFPTQVWQSATPLTGLSTAIGGLTPGQRYAFRVKATGNVA